MKHGDFLKRLNEASKRKLELQEKLIQEGKPYIIAAAVYIITEGNIDAKAVQLITEATESVVEYFDDDEKETDTENNAENEAEAV